MDAKHTYGPSCALHVDSNPFTRRASLLSLDPPKLQSHFFYGSDLPIDDPLSPVPVPNTASTPPKVPPCPFSAYDNAALEEAWLGLKTKGRKRLRQPFKTSDHGSYRSEKLHGHGTYCHDSKSSPAKDTISEEQTEVVGSSSAQDSKLENVTAIIQDIRDQDPQNGTSLGDAQKEKSPRTEQIPRAKSFNKKSKPIEAGTQATGPSEAGATSNDDVGIKEVHMMLSEDQSRAAADHDTPINSSEITKAEASDPPYQKQSYNPFHKVKRDKSPRAEKLEGQKSKEKTEKDQRKRNKASTADVTDDSSIGPGGIGKSKKSRARSLDERLSRLGKTPLGKDITGTPFLRAPTRDDEFGTAGWDEDLCGMDDADTLGETNQEILDAQRSPSQLRHPTKSNTHQSEQGVANKMSSPKSTSSLARQEKKGYIPVGISRLHLVEMPELQMKPIYWSPVHDVCSVVRGTWFYKDTMMPVESDVANQLEAGYEYMKPWTQTYADEVNSCLEIGPEAELKLTHKLWPNEESGAMDGQDTSKPSSTSGRGRKKNDEHAREGAKKLAANAQNKAAGNLGFNDDDVTLYAKSSVIYANYKDAQILKSSLLPSVPRGRKPLGPIRKGRAIGVPVVRGFDYKAWEKLHPVKTEVTATKARAGASASKSGSAATVGKHDMCQACLVDQERPKASDLVLVIHGIGQKLSERVESYHFTHAINGLRRQVNVELEATQIGPWLRRDLGGIMVLPINWRSTLSLDDGGSQPNQSSDGDRHGEQTTGAAPSNEFTLKDITVETIPTVRNLISDVMLDIPYYLSHHKPQMIEAVIMEANRVYRLWCRNNPGFQEYGRVHIVAHSLGSVMAIDILSNQPTHLPKGLNVTTTKVRSNMLEFDTKSLFFCGSPAGFFLLLNKKPLLPRRNRGKPGADADDNSKKLTGEIGTYGCLAVDNLYNIMHYNDPVAYRINAAVDKTYADSIQPATVPSTTSTWMQSFGSVFRGFRAVSPGAANLETLPSRPCIAKLPTTMELETHDFTQEEIAEKKMYLLNDNGQIDYFLRSGGGPLEIQYLNMLSAHSSYWTLQDFVRFLVVEVGRKSGKEETAIAMRVVKKAWGKR